VQPRILKEISARRWLSVLLAGVVCLAAWQVWLTVRLLEQDQNLESQRSHDRLGEIADLALAQLTGSLGDWDLGLHDLNSLPPLPSMQSHFPRNATFILVSENGISTYPHRQLLFTPVIPFARNELPESFEPVDELELREKQYDRAMALLKPLALKPATRAEALLRMARIEYKTNQADAALDAYKQLAVEDGVAPSGTPYALLAVPHSQGTWAAKGSPDGGGESAQEPPGWALATEPRGF